MSDFDRDPMVVIPVSSGVLARLLQLPNHASIVQIHVDPSRPLQIDVMVRGIGEIVPTGAKVPRLTGIRGLLVTASAFR